MPYQLRGTHYPHRPTFGTLAAARRAFRGPNQARSYLSGSFRIDPDPDYEPDTTNTLAAWCVYDTVKERDDDDTGAHATWIVKVPR